MTHIINLLTDLEKFPSNSTKWNSNEDVASILFSAQNHPEWISSEVSVFPVSSTQKLFRRLDGVYFKQDGYDWKRRKEGKLIREDHVKLKIQKQDVLAGSYVHSAIVPSFHRRAYWLINNPEVVFVHYLNVPSEERDSQPLHMRIAQTIRSSGLKLSRAQLEIQIQKIFFSMHPTEIKNLMVSIYENLSPSNQICNANEKATDRNKFKSRHATLEKSNSCSSTVNTPIAIRRQPSSNSDILVRQIERNDRGQSSLKNVNCDFQKCISYSVPCSMGRFVESDSVVSSFSVIDDLSASISTALTQSSNRSECVSLLTEIVDYSPDSVHVVGGTKVLLVGGWYLRDHNYAVVFGDKMVPATLCQAGVIRCFAPPNNVGKIEVTVFCDGMLISHPVYIDYYDSTSRKEKEMLMIMLYKRISFIRSYFIMDHLANDYNLSDLQTEDEILNICKEMMRYQLNPSLLEQSSTNNVAFTILHVCAALDFHRIFQIILHWG